MGRGRPIRGVGVLGAHRATAMTLALITTRTAGYAHATVAAECRVGERRRPTPLADSGRSGEADLARCRAGSGPACTAS
jgi:hypothetical protein